MTQPLKLIQLPNGKNALEWTHKEKPSLNHWYLTKHDEFDYWKIVKDFYSPKTKTAYYKIVEYSNCDVLYCGHTLAQVREIMRENTYRMVV